MRYSVGSHEEMKGSLLRRSDQGYCVQPSFSIAYLLDVRFLCLQSKKGTDKRTSEYTHDPVTGNILCGYGIYFHFLSARCL